MNSYYDINQKLDSNANSPWRVEIERLKKDICKTEQKILSTEKRRKLSQKPTFTLGYHPVSDFESLESETDASPPVERIAENQMTEKRSVLQTFEPVELETLWASPSQVMRKRLKDDPVPEKPSALLVDDLKSYFTLDYGLVSPKKNWASPPQRIKRSQNLEWTSPHRVIDRPNPEDSPGKWVPVSEPHQAIPVPAPPSPPPVYNAANQGSVINVEDYVDLPTRPQSQATFTIAQNAFSPEPIPKESCRVLRKTSILAEFQPERIVGVKKRDAPCGESAEEKDNALPGEDKVKRFVDRDGHVVKVTVLGDSAAATTNEKAKEIVESSEKRDPIRCEEEIPESKPEKKPPRKVIKKPLTNITKKITSGPPKPNVKLKERSAEETSKTRSATEQSKENEAPENELDDIKKDTEKMLMDLDSLLKTDNGTKPDEEETLAGRFPAGHKKRPRAVKNIGKPVVEEKKVEIPEKKKRTSDQSVQNYIKNQKQKRTEQLKTERERRKTEQEAKRKKLEELRHRSLQLAASSKRKKTGGTSQPVAMTTIKIMDTDEDKSMSLGLKQLKPKVSFNQSVSNLRKKPSETKASPKKQDEAKAKESTPEQQVEAQTAPESLKDSPKLTEDLKVESQQRGAKIRDDLNATLKKLAENLKSKMEQKEKQLRSRTTSNASKSVKDPLSQRPSRESLPNGPANDENQRLVTVDLETIESLKQDIKKISENFNVLHEIIADKNPTVPDKLLRLEPLPRRALSLPKTDAVDSYTPDWLKSVLPHPHPYNVMTAVRNKLKIDRRAASTPNNNPEKISMTSHESSIYAAPISNKYDSDFEAASTSMDQPSLSEEAATLKSSKRAADSTSEENYFSIKDDSGSDLSSSILDSDKQTVPQLQVNKKALVLKSPETFRNENSIKESIKTLTSITSKSTSTSKLSSFRENLILVPPDIKLISNNLVNGKLNNSNNVSVLTKSTNTSRSSKNSNDMVYKPVLIEDLNNTIERKINNEQKSESTIAEIIDNLTESDRSLKRTNEKPQNSIQSLDEARITGSFFNPEALHLQFQAELTLLETFQQSLSHFLEVERMKTLTEVNRVVNEKAINTEKMVEREDQAVQTSIMEGKVTPDDSARTEVEDSVKTELEDSIKTEIDESIKTEKENSINTDALSEHTSTSVKEESTDSKSPKRKEREKLDSSDSNIGISFQMLDTLMKDEELRSEHQLALIRLREKTLNEKIRAELTFLEVKKKALKEKGGDEEHNISAIKKRQRGILLKYQSEKEEIERLKKMHKIASEERKIMIKQQKQIQKMQVSTKDILVKLKKREKSPQKRVPLKPKILKPADSPSEIPEEISGDISNSILTDTINSMEETARQSIESDFGGSSRINASDGEYDLLRKNTKTLAERFSKGVEKSNRYKKVLREHEKKLLERRHCVEELLKWKKRLEDEENRLREMEKQAMNIAVSSKHRLLNKPLRDVKISVRDRSTSPFQFQDGVKSASDSSPWITEAIEAKKSSSISEAIDAIDSKEDVEVSNEKTEESLPEKLQGSASEDIPEELSKQSLNISNSRTVEYNSESFESPSSSETPKSQPVLTRSKSCEYRGSNKGITIKLALSPRIQGSRRRYSSGSDESINLSHTETASEQSDVESRISALHEQLRRRKLEAERLRREQKKAHRERLKAKEQSLMKQIQAYDTYIQKKKQELEQEYEYSSQAIVKPLIKQPKVAEKAGLKRPDSTSSESSLHPNVTLRKKEPEVLVPFDRLIGAPDKESDNEISEHIVSEESVSIKEQIEESMIETEVSETAKSSSISESLSKRENSSEGSQSESEEPSVSNVSIKTTLQSPEKPDPEKSDLSGKSDVLEEIADEEETSAEPKKPDSYSTDSFESDLDIEKSKTVSRETDEVSANEPSEVEIVSEVISEEEAEPESEVPAKESQIESETIEKITNSILQDLVSESLQIFNVKKQVKDASSALPDSRIESLTNSLAKGIISEAVNDIVAIYDRKKSNAGEEPISPERVTSEVRKRIHEILSQTPVGGTPRGQGRPQDMMITTYDVSPLSTTPVYDGNEDGSTEHDEFLSSLTNDVTRRKELDKEVHAENTETTNQHSEVDAYGQEWFDDDFGLSKTRREAEELRLQQLQIEQEIQQLQAQQAPYYYLREIPNKPPPPYTPPGKAAAEKPTSEADITAVMSLAVRILLDEMNQGQEVTEVKPTWELYGESDSQAVKCYKVFLFDLAKYILVDAVGSDVDEEKLPWMRTTERPSRYKTNRVHRTFDCLNETVVKQVLILFGFRQKVGKESLIVRWSRKKRDHVDELLVSESQEEESQWTRYDQDQITVKNEVTTAILDTLLSDATRVLAAIYTKKMKNAT